MELEEQIWDLVHNWCNEQSCEIPDFNRRSLMERILTLRQPTVISRSEQLVCDKCDFVELQGEIYQCTKCYKIEDRLVN